MVTVELKPAKSVLRGTAEQVAGGGRLSRRPRSTAPRDQSWQPRLPNHPASHPSRGRPPRRPAPASHRAPARSPHRAAAGPDDLHVIGLDCLELLLTGRGVTVSNLGAQVPSDRLVLAAAALDAVAVAVAGCSHTGPDATSATASLHAAHAAGFDVSYAGSPFDSSFIQRRLPGTALDCSVADSANMLARLLDGPTTASTASSTTHRSRAPA